MTLKRQSVQSLSDHKIARTFCVSQERVNSRTNGLEQNKWLFPLVRNRGENMTISQSKTVEKLELPESVPTDQ